MTEPTALQRTFVKLALLTQAKGISIDELIEMINSGASVSDILAALNGNETDSDS